MSSISLLRKRSNSRRKSIPLRLLCSRRTSQPRQKTRNSALAPTTVNLQLWPPPSLWPRRFTPSLPVATKLLWQANRKPGPLRLHRTRQPRRRLAPSRGQRQRPKPTQLRRRSRILRRQPAPSHGLLQRPKLTRLQQHRRILHRHPVPSRGPRPGLKRTLRPLPSRRPTQHPNPRQATKSLRVADGRNAVTPLSIPCSPRPTRGLLFSSGMIAV